MMSNQCQVLLATHKEFVDPQYGFGIVRLNETDRTFSLEGRGYRQPHDTQELTGSQDIWFLSPCAAVLPDLTVGWVA